jgi:hypothetical protein
MDYKEATAILDALVEDAQADDAKGREAALRELRIYIENSIPITLTDEMRGYFESEYPAYISYWGRVEGDEIVLLHEDDERILIPPDWINIGLRRLAAQGYHALGALLEGDYDAPSLDVLFQEALFGEVRYA